MDNVEAIQAVKACNGQYGSGVLALEKPTLQGAGVMDGATFLRGIVKEACPAARLTLHFQHFTGGWLHPV